MIEFVLGALLVGVGLGLGYGFRGTIAKLIGSASADVNKLSATAKLDAVKAKTEVVKAEIDAHTDVVTDLHTAISDLDKKL